MPSRTYQQPHTSLMTPTTTSAHKDVRDDVTIRVTCRSTTLQMITRCGGDSNIDGGLAVRQRGRLERSRRDKRHCWRVGSQERQPDSRWMFLQYSYWNWSMYVLTFCIRVEGKWLVCGLKTSAYYTNDYLPKPTPEPTSLRCVSLNTYSAISIRLWWHYLWTISNLLQRYLFVYIQPWFNTTHVRMAIWCYLLLGEFRSFAKIESTNHLNFWVPNMLESSVMHDSVMRFPSEFSLTMKLGQHIILCRRLFNMYRRLRVS